VLLFYFIGKKTQKVDCQLSGKIPYRCRWRLQKLFIAIKAIHHKQLQKAYFPKVDDCVAELQDVCGTTLSWTLQAWFINKINGVFT